MIDDGDPPELIAPPLFDAPPALEPPVLDTPPVLEPPALVAPPLLTPPEPLAPPVLRAPPPPGEPPVLVEPPVDGADPSGAIVPVSTLEEQAIPKIPNDTTRKILEPMDLCAAQCGTRSEKEAGFVPDEEGTLLA